MNNVIRFYPASSPRRVASSSRSAQILFFTGVRYQRMSDDERSPAPQPQLIRRKRRAAEGGGGRKSQR
jgi:hypothetical protein